MLFTTCLLIASGLLQALGYALYIRLTLKHDTRPDPLTWIMFSYGTFILTVMEWDRISNDPASTGVSYMLLLLPTICALCSVFVFGLIAYRGLKTVIKTGSKISEAFESPDRISALAFVFDIMLTIGYSATSGSIDLGFNLSGETRNLNVILFLIMSNASTVMCFVPIIRSTRKDPSRERFLPWFIWTLAYIVLGYATYQLNGLWTELMLYPASCAVLHGLVGLIALRRKRATATGAVRAAHI